MTTARALLGFCVASLTACELLTNTDGLTGGGPGADMGDAGRDANALGDANGARDATGSGDAAGFDGGDSGGDGGGAACTGDAGCPGGPCYAGRCLPKPTRVGGSGAAIFALAVVQDRDLYYADLNEVLHQPLDGGALEKIDSNGARGNMATDGADLYFPFSGDIFRTPLDGGATALLYRQYDSPITAVTLAGGRLYFTAPDPGNPGPTSLFSIPTAFASDGGFAVAQEHVVAAFVSAESMHAAQSTLYVADRGANVVSRVRAGGSTPTPIFKDVPQVNAVFADPPLVWLASPTTNMVYRTLADGTGPLEPIAVGQSGLSQIVVTSTTVYWSAGPDVFSLPR